MNYNPVPVDNIHFEIRSVTPFEARLSDRPQSKRVVVASPSRTSLGRAFVVPLTMAMFVLPAEIHSASSRDIVPHYDQRTPRIDAPSIESRRIVPAEGLELTFEQMLQRAASDIASIGRRDASQEDAEMVALSRQALVVLDAQRDRSAESWGRDLAESLAHLSDADDAQG